MSDENNEAGSGRTLAGLEDAKAVDPATPNSASPGSMQSEELLPGVEGGASNLGLLPLVLGVAAPPDSAVVEPGTRKATTSNLASLLISDALGSVAWDEFLNIEVLIRRSTIVPLQEHEITRLIVECEQQGLENVRRADLKNVLHMLAKQNSFDSAKKWLRELPRWDGITRVERFLPDYCGSPPTLYELAVGRYIWTAMVARILEPGCKIDMVPVLVGKQGVGKSSLLRGMAPTPEHWGEASLTERDLAAKVLGKIIVAWEEMRGIRGRVDADTVKTFITSPYIELRSRSQKGMDRHPRRFVIFGTSNRRDFLRDPTGHRRYLPFGVQWIDLRMLDDDKEQLWAEAYHMALLRQQNGKPLVDYEDAERLVITEYQKYLNQGRWVDDDDLLAWLKAGHDKFRTDDALKVVLGPYGMIGRREKIDMAETLRQLGYELKSTYVGDPNRRPDRWHRPQAASQTGISVP